MSDCKDGRTFLIPRCRRLTWDLLYFNQAVPQCGHDRIFDLAELREARAAASPRVSWAALFLKAYGLLSAEFPELRQTWYRWPWAHLYQHPSSVGILTVQREYRGDPWLFWGRISNPEERSLRDIQQAIDDFRNGAVPELFRKEIQLASLPTLVRRLIWGWNIHCSKGKRAKRLGTFFLSTLAGQGVEIQVPPAIHTGCLTYGPLDKDGRARVTLAYDHRVTDGAMIARCLAQLETILCETLRLELLNPATISNNVSSAA